MRYRFKDAMGDIVIEQEFDSHAAAIAWALDTEDVDEEIQRVEYLGREGDWRWAGPVGVS